MKRHPETGASTTIGDLRHPPTFVTFVTIQFPVTCNLTMGHVLGYGHDMVCKHWANGTTVIMDQLLAFCIHCRAFVVIQLCTCCFYQAIEFIGGVCAFPCGIVPFGIVCIRRLEHPIFGRTTTPITGAPAFFVPHVGPISIAWFADDFDLDAGFCSGCSDQLCRIYSA